MYPSSTKPDRRIGYRTFLLPVLPPRALVDPSRASRSSSPRTRKMTTFVPLSPLFLHTADSSLFVHRSPRSQPRSPRRPKATRTKTAIKQSMRRYPSPFSYVPYLALLSSKLRTNLLQCSYSCVLSIREVLGSTCEREGGEIRFLDSIVHCLQLRECSIVPSIIYTSSLPPH